MIEAARAIVTIGRGKEVEADEVLISAEDEAKLFEESLVVQAIGDTQYSEVQVFAPNPLVTSAKAKMQELGIPTALQLSETEWTPGATYETRY